MPLSTPPHPYGVRPRGCYLTDCAHGGARPCRSSGLGALDVLSDELMLSLLGYLGACELGRLCCVSRALYVFGNHDSLWRVLTLEELGDSDRTLCFRRTWKLTLRAALTSGASEQERTWRPVTVQGIFSDLLFQPWLCSSGIDPRWMSSDNIPRRDAADLSRDAFVTEFEGPNQPVIITGLVNKWPAYREWDRDKLRTAYGDVAFNAGGFQMTLSDYFDYAAEVASSPITSSDATGTRVAAEETPLYLFGELHCSTCSQSSTASELPMASDLIVAAVLAAADQDFVRKAPALGGQFEVPKYFDEDLLGLLGPRPARPAFRWLIVGPPLSGSTFHVK